KPIARPSNRRGRGRGIPAGIWNRRREYQEARVLSRSLRAVLEGGEGSGCACKAFVPEHAKRVSGTYDHMGSDFAAGTQAHSMTASARASSAAGTVSPSAFAVFRLTTSSNLVGCSIGRSAGRAPLRILST